MSKPTVERLCYGLRFVERDGKKLLQARWMPFGLDASMSMTPNPGASDWENVPLEVEAAPVK
jgi:hypothetical protein